MDSGKITKEYPFDKIFLLITPWIAEVVSLQKIQAVKSEANLKQYKSSFRPIQVFQPLNAELWRGRQYSIRLTGLNLKVDERVSAGIIYM